MKIAGQADVNRALAVPGQHGAGNGLWLVIGSKREAYGGTRHWIFRYAKNGKAHTLGLGRYPDRTLASARGEVARLRTMLVEGGDPTSDRRKTKAAARAGATAQGITFDDCVRQYLADHLAGWRNEKHKWQWSRTLEQFAAPIIGDKRVAEIETADVADVLRPIWSKMPETASRLRGRIEKVLDWAKAMNYRSGDNPAAWKGNLQSLFPAKSKVQKVEHLAALPYRDLPAFMATLGEETSIGAMALRFTILTAARTGETIGATWGEIDLAERLWIIPAERMKAHREHRVPLSAPAVAILSDMLSLAGNGEPDRFVFPGMKEGRPLSNMTMVQILRRMGHGDITVHGFRSTFRDWCAETGVDGDLAEMALAHTINSKVEAAYRRGDMFERRRQLADEWANYCLRVA
jgi:integrase